MNWQDNNPMPSWEMCPCMQESGKICAGVYWGLMKEGRACWGGIVTQGLKQWGPTLLWGVPQISCEPSPKATLIPFSCLICCLFFCSLHYLPLCCQSLSWSSAYHTHWLSVACTLRVGHARSWGCKWSTNWKGRINTRRHGLSAILFTIMQGLSTSFEECTLSGEWYSWWVPPFGCGAGGIPQWPVKQGTKCDGALSSTPRTP